MSILQRKVLVTTEGLDQCHWTTGTLREYIIAIITSNGEKYSERFESSENANSERFDASQSAVNAAFLAQQTAMQTALTTQKLAVDTALSGASAK